MYSVAHVGFTMRTAVTQLSFQDAMVLLPLPELTHRAVHMCTFHVSPQS